ncbi:MAG: DUF3459 domain-containing protein [Ruminococcaceae bacterium]|nr:DUF3459 domain-containing protein [Oscillospiraceae bacterium]
MYPKLFDKIEAGKTPTILCFANGKPTEKNAFRRGDAVSFTVRVPRALGASAVVLRLGADGTDPVDLPLDFSGIDHGQDLYTVSLETDRLAPAEGGLFRYEFLILRGARTLFTNSTDNLHFSLSDHNARRFRMLVYRADFKTPAWFSGGTMYHIFVDRFFRAKNCGKLHTGRLEEDWDNGIPQFAEKPGDPLANDLFFGGNLAGITEKLDYLADLGVTVLYLSPIFESVSNHRYDTGDYEKVDSLLGGDEAFAELIAAAHKKGIRVVLDGVFNHTGDDSRYFNRRGNYPDVGAYQSPESPYYEWFTFRDFPNDYESWWGIPILPRLCHQNKSCRAYFTGKNGIAARWIRAGADGWRLDVADELCDDFLNELRRSVKAAGAERKTDPLILGEVWENAADKVSYGSLRPYLWGGQLDGVMNYPFRNAVLALLLQGDSAFFRSTLTELYVSYPPAVCDCLMNLLGTHDTSRILTVLGDPSDGEGLSNAELSIRRLPLHDRRKAISLLKIAAVLQFTVYGVPSIYYGDEVGLEGYHDPFCRMPYPWNNPDRSLRAFYRRLGALRASAPALDGGTFRFLDSPDGSVCYERKARGRKPSGKSGAAKLLVAANLSAKSVHFRIPAHYRTTLLHTGKPPNLFPCNLVLPPKTAVVLE